MTDTQYEQPVCESNIHNNNDKSKNKKKHVKNLDSLLKDLPRDATEEQKMNALMEKYDQKCTEMKEINTKLKQSDQILQSCRQERDRLQTDRNKLVLQKEKLETLCRELQKQNKNIQDENLSRNRAEEEKRREVSDHFSSSIGSIQGQLTEYHERNAELRQENQQLADKLADFMTQHKAREAHVDKVMHTRDLEVKLAEAKLNKVKCQVDQERVKSQQKLLAAEQEVKLMKDRYDARLAVEAKLKEQIEFYKERYQAFNKTVGKSNQMFENAKVEMEKFAKRVEAAESETVEWRGRCEIGQSKINHLVAELASANKRVDQLSQLCRALQSRSSLVVGDSKRSVAVAPNGDQHMPADDAVNSPNSEDQNDIVVVGSPTNEVDTIVADSIKKIIDIDKDQSEKKVE